MSTTAKSHDNRLATAASRVAHTLVCIAGGKAGQHPARISPADYRERSPLTRWKLSISTNGVTWFSYYCTMFGEDDLSTEIGIAAARARFARPDMSLTGSALAIQRMPSM